MIGNDFAVAVDSFPWKSKDQKEGYLAFVRYLREFGMSPKLPIDPLATFLIQKDVESHEYWNDYMANQLEMVRSDNKRLQDEVASLMREVDSLSIAVKSLASAVQALTKKD